MSSDLPFAASLRRQVQFFERTLECFDESDSEFAPGPDTYTVAAHVAHTASTIKWFIEGAFSPEGFAMNFAEHIAEAKTFTSLSAAKSLLEQITAECAATLEATTMIEMMTPLPEGPIMGGAPRVAIIEAMADHTAHHRGALSVYARLLNKEPAMPYA
jgi:uncharacterized damage-inducible protein DinB